MTTAQKLIRKKMRLLESAEYLQNISEALPDDDGSPGNEQRLEGLKENSRRKPVDQESGGPGECSSATPKGSVALISRP